MFKNKFNRILKVGVVMMLTFAMCSTVMANEIDKPIKDQNLQLDKYLTKSLTKDLSNSLGDNIAKDVSVDKHTSGTLKVDKSKKQEIDESKLNEKYNLNPVTPFSMIDGRGSIRFNANDSLTSADPSDLWFFNTSSSKLFISRIVTNNPNYYVQLFTVDWNQGLAYPTNYVKPANELLALDGLPAGEYALGVFSNGSVGDSYTMQLNAANPSGYNNLIYLSSSLMQITTSYRNGDVYTNGTYVYNPGGSTSHLDWSRVRQVNNPGGYSQRTHDISDVVIKSVSNPVSYSSSYASSNNAVLVYVKEGTLFMFHESIFQSGTNTQYHSSFVDVVGKTTPRRIDTDDMGFGDHILVYDLNTGKAIDFFSVLNFHYSSGNEAVPKISYLN